MRNWRKCRVSLFACAVTLFVLAGCGSDGNDTTSSAPADAESNTVSTGSNACPAEGCKIDFAAIEKTGDELTVTWDMNFDPLFADNHIHIYWDNFQAEQVSGDAADNGFEQGDWVPTDAAPSYTTEGPASTSVRGDSTTLCLVAADGDHNVIDPASQVCRDVSEYL